MRIVNCLFLLFFIGCGSPKETPKEGNDTSSLDRRTQIRLNQYKVEGAKIYATYCENCHQNDGKGLASLYPPLAASDYLLENLPRAACIIKNGQNKAIIVNGTSYNQMMPANPITPLEVAEVLTFISNSWGNEAGLTSVKEVEKWLKKCDELSID